MSKLPKETRFEEVPLGNLPRVAAYLVGKMLSVPQSEPLIVGVSGDLGAGKTTLFQAVLQGIASRWDPSFSSTGAQSPTFTYVKSYEGKRISLWHADAYRMPLPLWKDIQMAWEESLEPRRYVLWVEWFNLLGEEIQPALQVDIQIPAQTPNTRNFRILE
jgi:tRNA threonylcarbamoyladenosine biosynthesis protein TsaE